MLGLWQYSLPQHCRVDQVSISSDFVSVRTTVYTDRGSFSQSINTSLATGQTTTHRFRSECLNQEGEYVQQQRDQTTLHAIDGSRIATLGRSISPIRLISHWLFYCDAIDKSKISVVDLDHPAADPIVLDIDIVEVRNVETLDQGLIAATAQNWRGGIRQTYNLIADLRSHRVFNLDVFNWIGHFQRTSEGILALDYDYPRIYSSSNGSLIRPLVLPEGTEWVGRQTKLPWTHNQPMHRHGKPHDYVLLRNIALDNERYWNIRTGEWLATDTSLNRICDLDPVRNAVLVQCVDGDLEWVRNEALRIKLPGKMLETKVLDSGGFVVVIDDPWFDYQIRCYDPEGRLTKTLRPMLYARCTVGLLMIVSVVWMISYVSYAQTKHDHPWIDVLVIATCILGVILMRSHRLGTGWVPQGSLMSCEYGVLAALVGVMAFWIVFGWYCFSFKFLGVQVLIGVGIWMSRDVGLRIDGLPKPLVHTLFLFSMALFCFAVLRGLGFSVGCTVRGAYRASAGQFRILDLMVITTAIAMLFFVFKQSGLNQSYVADWIVRDLLSMSMLLVVSVVGLCSMVRWPWFVRGTSAIGAIVAAVLVQTGFGLNVGYDWQTGSGILLLHSTLGGAMWLMLRSFRARGWDLRFTGWSSPSASTVSSNAVGPRAMEQR